MSGKGDKPRNCFSKRFRDNYDEINWGGTESKRDYKGHSRDILHDEPRARKQQGYRSGDYCERSCKCKKES